MTGRKLPSSKIENSKIENRKRSSAENCTTEVQISSPMSCKKMHPSIIEEKIRVEVWQTIYIKQNKRAKHMQKRWERFLIFWRQTYRQNAENGSDTALRGCERIVEAYDYCRRIKWNT